MNFATWKTQTPAFYADLDAVVKKHGLKLTKRRGLFDEGTQSAKFTLEVSYPTTAGGGFVDKAAVDLQRYRPEWVGKAVHLRGEAFTVVGYNPRKPKWAVVIARAGDGKRLLVTEQTVEGQLRA